MSEKPTPGPWGDGRTDDSIISDSPNGRQDSITTNFYGGYVIAESVSSNNKSLIKAAPDLLAACQAVNEFFTRHADAAITQSEVGFLQLVRTALTKAEGAPEGEK